MASLSELVRTSLLCVACLIIAPAMAGACGSEVRITFTEDSPDTFLVEFLHGSNKSRTLSLRSVRIDLKRSVGGAYIDTVYGQDQSSAGNSAGVAKPVLNKIIGFKEGGTEGVLEFERFAVGQSFTLMVDLDDNASGGDFDPNHLDAGEMDGAEGVAVLVAPNGKTETISGNFNRDGIANLGSRACV